MDYFMGQINLFPYNFVPEGWAPCNGQVLNVSAYEALFSLIGNKFGGDGKTTFALPNLDATAISKDIHYYICIQGMYPPKE